MTHPTRQGCERSGEEDERDKWVALQGGRKSRNINVEILHKADPWAGQDCLRPHCMLCKTKIKTCKQMNQDCTKRNIIYEIWCMKCYQEDKNKIDEEYRVGDPEELNTSWRPSGSTNMLERVVGQPANTRTAETSSTQTAIC